MSPVVGLGMLGLVLQLSFSQLLCLAIVVLISLEPTEV